MLFAPDGTYRESLPAPWASNSTFSSLTPAGDGRIFATDAERGRVWEYGPGSETPVWWSGAGMRRPIGITLDGAGQVFTVDEETKRIYVFRR